MTPATTSCLESHRPGSLLRVKALWAGLRVARADNPGPLTLDGTRSYLVGAEETVLIDPGPSGPEQQALLEKLIGSRAVGFVCLTHAHADHSGAAADIVARLGCEVAASAETLARLDLSGRPLADGDELPVNGGESSLVALATPGHTRDHTSYLRLPDRELFTGDLVLGAGSSVILYPDGELTSYLASLDRLLAERPAVILPGHGSPVRPAAPRLREYIAHRLERGRQIEEALRAGARSVDAIRASVYGSLPAGIERAADASIRAHLSHLEDRGGRLPAIAGYAEEATADGESDAWQE
jgi:glyoxylase-like metal-dependent hydrolase (beta-lactamase superfamily II)